MIKLLEKHRIFCFILAILIGAEIFYFSTLSGSGGSGGFSITPIVYHFVVFFLFNTFLLIAIKGKDKLKIKHLILALILSLIYAILDEFHQSFVPGRDASIKDMLVNSAGIFFSLIILLIYNRKSKKN